MNSLIIPLFVFIYGLLIGSFLNVCIYRIPLGKTVVKGRSYCPACSALIPWYCNIPVFSYLFLKGKCLYCKSKISPIYPVVELLNALSYLLVLYVYGFTLSGFFIMALFSVLIIISFIDISLQIIPDGLVLLIGILGAGNAIYQVLTFGAPWYSFVIGFFAASLLLLILGLVYENGMGGGDIKLMAAAGLFVGWKLILLSLFVGAIFGGVAALILILSKKGSLKSAIPFGPFLSLGIATCTLFGEQLLSLYLGLFM